MARGKLARKRPYGRKTFSKALRKQPVRKTVSGKTVARKDVR
jgi:hypothetical protein